MTVFDQLANNPLIPVLVIDDPEHAVPVAEALLAGGVSALEVTLRTTAALDVVERMARALPEAIVGVGTVLRAEQFAEARDAGARFAVSPGLSEKLAAAAGQSGMPWLPGAVTASEMIMALELGIGDVKFFPASIAGGAPALKGFSSVFPDLRFCPTGGVNAGNMADYLRLPNVKAVGGSWLVTPELLANRDWAQITRLAGEALAVAAELGRRRSDLP
ncbi:MAG: bifunctional 4-hydroxy-2-oxoglutarate aldolase/2-dehydro-3-deoxy-phosphogluconate aldolase [Gammaproteobacteria bacterium]|nr:bifunctional 4-hydroxy-2-oxoglutarate aldolase/2-dehydro-3-deoxy-phosphogluconate aldolase [Gammaproteobacteria bacterium]